MALGLRHIHITAWCLCSAAQAVYRCSRYRRHSDVMTHDAAGSPRTIEHVETVRMHDSQISCSDCGNASFNRHKMMNARVCWMNVLVNLRNGRLRRLQFSKCLRDGEHSISKYSRETGTPKGLSVGDLDAGRTSGLPRPLELPLKAYWESRVPLESYRCRPCSFQVFQRMLPPYFTA